METFVRPPEVASQQVYKLEKTDVPKAQAEALTEIIREQVHASVSSSLSDVSTKDDLGKLRVEMATGFAEIRAEMATGFAEIRAEMATGFAEIRAETATKDELAKLRVEMATGFAEIRAEMATKDEIANLRAETATKDEVAGIKETLTGIKETLAGIKTALRYQYAINGLMMSALIFLIVRGM